MQVIETPFGYRTLDPRLVASLKVETATADIPEFAEVKVKSGALYHAETVWPWEQAKLHRVGKRFGLPRVMEVSARMMPWIASGDPELLLLHADGDVGTGDAGYELDGCDPQLLMIFAKKYFAMVL